MNMLNLLRGATTTAPKQINKDLDQYIKKGVALRKELQQLKLEAYKTLSASDYSFFCKKLDKCLDQREYHY